MNTMNLILPFFFFLLSCSNNLTEPNATAEKKLFLVAGQSNAQGHGNQLESIDVGLDPIYEYDANIGATKRLKDPVGANGCYFEPAESGSAWPAFGKKYYELTGDTTIIIQAAKGGSSCHPLAEVNGWGTWAPENNLFKCSVSKAKAAEKKLRSKISGIIWCQGENDADAINRDIINAFQYKQALVSLINSYRIALGKELKFYIILTGYNTAGATEGFTAVRMMQQEIADQDPNTYIIYSKTDQDPKLNWMHDVVHYNQSGLNNIGITSATEVVKIEARPK